MPILSLKNNPPPRSFKGSIIEQKGTWWIAHVKPRQEKAFAFDSLDSDIDYYLPLYEKKTKRPNGKFRKTLMLLFPNYVPFISNEPYKLYSNPRIINLLTIKNQDKFRLQLHHVSLAIDSKQEILPDNCLDVKNGDWVRIIAGDLTGLVGVVMNHLSRTSLLLMIEGLGCARIKVESSLLEKLSVSPYQD